LKIYFGNIAKECNIHSCNLISCSRKAIVQSIKTIYCLDEYSGAFYTACPVAGNRHSILMETNVPEAETA